VGGGVGRKKERGHSGMFAWHVPLPPLPPPLPLARCIHCDNASRKICAAGGSLSKKKKKEKRRKRKKRKKLFEVRSHRGFPRDSPGGFLVASRSPLWQKRRNSSSNGNALCRPACFARIAFHVQQRAIREPLADRA